jgi:hypothetical protein
MFITIRKAAQLVAGVVIASAAVVACTSTVQGTPLADPNAPALTSTTTAPTTTRPPTTTTARPGGPSSPSVPTRTSAPGAPGTPAVADTTCDEYINLDEDAQREVISAIGQENDLVALNPELWITVTSALCTFAEPSTPVREVLAGQGIR